PVDREDGPGGDVAEVVAVGVEALGGVDLGPAGRDLGVLRRDRDRGELGRVDLERRGVGERAVGAGHRVVPGLLRATGVIGAGAGPVDREDGPGGDVAQVVAVGVEALGGVDLGPAGRDLGVLRRDLDRGELGRVDLERRGVGERAVGAGHRVVPGLLRATGVIGAGAGPVDREDGPGGDVAQVVAVGVEALGGVDLGPAGRDLGVLRRDLDRGELGRVDLERRGVGERAVGAGHGVVPGLLRATGVIGAGAGPVDREDGPGGDVAEVVAVGVEALGGVDLGPAGRDLGVLRRDLDRGELGRVDLERRGVGERAVGAGHRVVPGLLRATGVIGAGAGPVDREDGPGGDVAEVVAVGVEALGGVDLGPAGRDLGRLRRDLDRGELGRVDLERRGVGERPVGAGHGVVPGLLRATGVIGAGAGAVDREDGPGGDVAEVVAVGVEALGGVDLGPAGRDLGVLRRDLDRGELGRVDLERRGVGERAVGAGHRVVPGLLRATGVIGAGAGPVDREDGPGGDVAEVVAVGVEALGGVDLGPAGRDLGVLRRDLDRGELGRVDLERRGVGERAVGAGHRVVPGLLRATGVIGAGAGPVDREDGPGGDVAQVVAVGVEALGGVDLGPAGRDLGVL